MLLLFYLSDYGISHRTVTEIDGTSRYSENRNRPGWSVGSKFVRIFDKFDFLTLLKKKFKRFVAHVQQIEPEMAEKVSKFSAHDREP